MSLEVERMLRLAEQCLERAKSFIGKGVEPPDGTAALSPASPSSPGRPEPVYLDVLPATTAIRSGEAVPSITEPLVRQFESLQQLESAPGVTNPRNCVFK